MLRERIIRAWKDPDYRNSLSEEDLAELPENPAGAIELTDDELDMAAGGSWGGSSSGRPRSSGRPSRRRVAYNQSSSGSSGSSQTQNRSSGFQSSSGQPTSMNPYTYTKRNVSQSSSSSSSDGYARWSSR